MKPTPATQRHNALYRAQLSAKIAYDAIDGKKETPPTCTSMEYAMYNLCCAVEEIAKALEIKHE